MTLVAEGILHKTTEDIIEALNSNVDNIERWNKLTPIQRNEWICWVTIVKKIETRKQHIERMMIDLRQGKRQPCCWPGCPHRKPNTQKWFK